MTILTTAAANGAPIPGGYAPGIDGANALAFSHAPLGGFTQMSNVIAYAGRLSYTPSFIPGFAGSSAVYYSPNVTPRGAYGDDGRILGSNAMTIFDTEADIASPIPDWSCGPNMSMSTSATRKTCAPTTIPT